MEDTIADHVTPSDIEIMKNCSQDMTVNPEACDGIVDSNTGNPVASIICCC